MSQQDMGRAAQWLRHARNQRPCALPLCAVHPETRGEGEERSGRDDTGQASREEAAEQTVGTGYPQGSGPGDGSATPAPPSSRPGGAVHLDPFVPDLCGDDEPEVWMDAPDDADYSAVHPEVER